MDPSALTAREEPQKSLEMRLQSHLLRRGDRKGQSLFREFATSCKDSYVPAEDRKMLRMTPRKALAPLSPNVGNSPKRAPRTSDGSTVTTPGRGTPSRRNRTARQPPSNAVSCGEAQVQADMMPVCCHVVMESLQSAIRERDTAQQQLSLLKDVTDEVLQQAGNAAQASSDSGGEMDEAKMQELKSLLARAQAAIASEKVEHVQLQSKYAVAVKKVAELQYSLKAAKMASCSSSSSSSSSSASNDAACEGEAVTFPASADLVSASNLPIGTTVSVPVVGETTEAPRIDQGCQASCPSATKEEQGEAGALEDAEREEWKKMLEESDARCDALCRHLSQIHEDEERLVSLLTRKIKALTRERDEALRRSSASPRTPLSSRKSSSLRSTPSPSTPGGGARVSLPTLEEGSEAAVGEASSVGDGGEEGRANGDDDVVLTPSLMVHDGAFQDAAGPFSTPETMRYALDVTPKVLNSGEEGEGGGEGEEHAQGAAAGDDKHEEAVNGPSLCHTQERALSVSPACARSPAASPCEGDDQGIFPPFHRFFSEPDFDSSFKAWVRMQSMHHVQDTVPEAVSSWMTQGLPWLQKDERQEESKDAGPLAALGIFFL